MTRPDAQEIAQVMEAKNWTLETNPLGLWMIGPLDDNGIMNVLGMGGNIMEAFQMARRSERG